MKLKIPTRRQVIKDFRKSKGRVAAVFPIHYPRELFRAHGFLPVEVWGPPGVDDAPAGSHLQAYTCAIVRNGLSFLLSGGLDDVDVIVVPNACDSLQGLGSLLLDFVHTKTPVLTFYAPRATRQSDAEYLQRELGEMGEELARISDVTPTAEGLREAIAREVEADELLSKLHRRRDELSLDTRSLYDLIRSREFLPAERFSELARSVMEGAVKSGDMSKAGAGIPIVLSGIVPEPMEVFDALSEMGARVVADDFAACGRRLYPAGLSDEPLRRIGERLQGGPPDPTRGSPIQARIQHILRLVRERGAKGVVFYDVKFCEPEQFDVPLLREALKEKGIPSIALEVDLSAQLPGQTVTRLEAFVEMLR